MRSIEVVEPSDISGLVVVPGEDLVSLVTCTPLGINTHRLIVEGERIADPDEDVAAGENATAAQPVPWPW